MQGKRPQNQRHSTRPEAVTDRPHAGGFVARKRPSALAAAAASSILVGVLALIVTTLIFACPARADQVERGMYLVAQASWKTDIASEKRTMTELNSTLGVKTIRVNVFWPRLEPVEGHFDETYLAELSDYVDSIRAADMRALLMFYSTPEWASDRSLWNNPPQDGRTKPGQYTRNYPVGPDHFQGLTASGEHLASFFAGRVAGYEFWCEPNLWVYIYPQQAQGDGLFAVHRYLDMLKAFRSGVKAADPNALIIAGETAPYGDNTRYRTSPLRFAQAFKAAGAEQYFDVYSHHPYSPGGSTDLAPDVRPSDPRTTVSLGNIGDLLAVFPDKPFYLTEYGYNTQPAAAFGDAVVDEATQADYTRRALTYVERFPQVKLLIWWPFQDVPSFPLEADHFGAQDVYSGFVRVDGSRKPSWYVLAGDVSLTLGEGAGSSSRGVTHSELRGGLTSLSGGSLSHIALTLERRTTGGKWKALAQMTTDSLGTYSVALSLETLKQRTARYRVTWPGVVRSKATNIVGS